MWGALKDTLSATSLLLMPALDALEVEGVGSWRRTRGRQLTEGRVHHVKTAEGDLAESWFLSTRRVPIAGNAIGALDDELWAGVHDLEVSVGIPWRRGKPDAKVPCPSLHVYFPTDDAVGRKLLLHGDFYLDSTRRHVQTEGPGKAVTETALRAVVELVADCAEELNRQFPSNNEILVDILSPHDEPEGFGLVLCRALDKKLAETSFVKSVTGASVSPEHCEVLDVSLESRGVVDFVAMMEGVDLLAPPHLEKSVRNWLVELGAAELSPAEVITKLRPARVPTYDRAVRAVARWWQSTGRWGEDIGPLAVLQSTDGEWCCAAAVCRQVGDYPGLPGGFALATYRPPKAKDTCEFIDKEFDIRELDSRSAFDHVMRSIDLVWPDADASRCREMHDFAWAVFRKAPELVSKHARRSALPVPVRKWRRGSTVVWAKAKDVYFSKEWTGSRDLETLYGPFREREFLAAEKPSSSRRARERERFYRAIGVADNPRQVVVTSLWDAPREWRKVEEVVAAERCPDGHPHTARGLRAGVIDRLPEILDSIDLKRARVLVRILARSNRPYGTDAEVWCEHSSHRGSRGRNRVKGLQRWHLENSSWVPLKPTGRDGVLGRPTDAWTHVNSEELRACVRLADVSSEHARRLNLPRMTQPRGSTLCQALRHLHHNFPDLADAPDGVAGGVVRLVRKLEPVAKPGEVVASWLGALPARRMARAAWSEKPAVPDFDVPEDLDLEVLPDGKWTNLREVFDLPLASELVDSRTEFQGLRYASVHGVSSSDRAAIAAILHSKGSDLRRVSRKLGRLSVKEADAIKTVFMVGSSQIVLQPTVHLEKQADEFALIVVAGPSDAKVTFEVAQRLAEYLNDAATEAIFIYLQMGAECLSALEITDEDIEEAQNAIGRYRKNDEPADETREQRMADDETGGEVKAGAGRTKAGASLEMDGETSPGRRPWFGPEGPVAIGGRKQFTDAPAVGLRVSKSSAPMRTGAAGGTGRSGGPSLRPEDRKEIEERAIRTATDYAKDHLGAVEVCDVQLSNRGWDLEIVFGDGSWWPVEVKGFGRTASRFILTRNEMEAARREKDYRLLLVTGVLTKSGQVLCLERVAASLDSLELSPMSWVVSSWEGSVTSVTDWSEVHG